MYMLAMKAVGRPLAAKAVGRPQAEEAVGRPLLVEAVGDPLVSMARWVMMIAFSFGGLTTMSNWRCYMWV